MKYPRTTSLTSPKKTTSNKQLIFCSFFASTSKTMLNKCPKKRWIPTDWVEVVWSEPNPEEKSSSCVQSLNSTYSTKLQRKNHVSFPGCIQPYISNEGVEPITSYLQTPSQAVRRTCKVTKLLGSPSGQKFKCPSLIRWISTYQKIGRTCPFSLQIW